MIFDALKSFFFCKMPFKGKWIFNEKNDKFEYHEFPKLEKNVEKAKLRPTTSFIEGKLGHFNKDTRPITVDDVKDQVNKLSTEKNKKMFEEFRINREINEFLKYLTIYFDQFLKVCKMRFSHGDFFNLIQIFTGFRC